MVHEWLGVPLDSISFIQGDTNEVAVGRGTYGSRSMHVGGVNCAYLDSHVDFIRDDIDPFALAYLIDIRDSKVTSDDGK